MANQALKVRRETITACMTCPLCNKLFRDATTIIECLHTFCRKCICKKILDEEIECCPVCNINLGSVPLEKLRQDHNLQDVRAKIFPFKRRKVEAPEVLPSVTSVTLPARRKERSLSSLVVSTPRVSTQTTMTGRRTKGIARKAANLRASGFSIQKTIKKEEDSEDNHPESPSSPETLNKFSQNIRQTASLAETSNSLPNKGKEKNSESSNGKLDPWKPLNCLVEVANRSRSFKSNSKASDAKLEPMLVPNTEAQLRRTKVKENKCKLKVEDDKDSCDPISLDTAKTKKLRRVRRKREEAFGKSFISSHSAVDATGSRHERTGPIWFSLVASRDQDGDATLPQIPASYLKIKDGSMPVSFIQKYLMRKLDLTTEAEVEIKCMGKPVVPSLQLYNLIDFWSQSAPASQRVTASVGSSAKDFVMVLAYSRKAQHS